MFKVDVKYDGPAGKLNQSRVYTTSVYKGHTTGLAIKYVKQGAELYQIGQQEILLTKGQFLLLPADVSYRASHQLGQQVTEGICVDLCLSLPETTNLALLCWSPFQIDQVNFFKEPFTNINLDRQAPLSNYA
ncbi:MAG: hypothetical protein AAFU67_18595, partial [Bacteroidota bacterium]